MLSLVNILKIKQKQCFNISNTPFNALSCQLSKNKTDNILIYQTHLLMVSLVNFLNIKQK